MKLWVLTVCSLILLQSSCSASSLAIQKQTVGHYWQCTKDVAVGVVCNIKHVIPTPTEIFNRAKNYLIGLPFEKVANVINTVCSSLMSSNHIKPKVTPDLYKLNFQLMTPCKKYSIPMFRPADLLQIEEFDVTKQTVILVTGWRTTVNTSQTIVDLAKAYNCRGGVNFMAVDAGYFVDTLFTWSALNTEAIGEYLGQGLVKLAEIVPLRNIHLIGHSLGAHICGAAARTFTDMTDKFIPRVTGLDPARPCFNEGEKLSGLMRGDADFIDIIHSNTGVLGKREPLGDVDFYPDGIMPLPSGCYSVICAHERAWLYYVETVYPGNENNFIAKRCTSLLKLRLKICNGKSVPMGYAASDIQKGNFVLNVKRSAPFGLNSDVTRSKQHAACGSCPAS